MSVAELPAPVKSFVEATNRSDLDGVMSSFESDALVNDNRREFRGRAAIREWVAREIIGDRVTMRVTDVTRWPGAVAVSADVDGNFDKSNLPDPVTLAFYFSTLGERIVQLVIVLNRPAA